MFVSRPMFSKVGEGATTPVQHPTRPPPHAAHAHHDPRTRHLVPPGAPLAAAALFGVCGDGRRKPPRCIIRLLRWSSSGDSRIQPRRSSYAVRSAVFENCEPLGHARTNALPLSSAGPAADRVQASRAAASPGINVGRFDPKAPRPRSRRPLRVWPRCIDPRARHQARLLFGSGRRGGRELLHSGESRGPPADAARALSPTPFPRRGRTAS